MAQQTTTFRRVGAKSTKVGGKRTTQYTFTDGAQTVTFYESPAEAFVFVVTQGDLDVARRVTSAFQWDRNGETLQVRG